jgi:hypothetical protein
MQRMEENTKNKKKIPQTTKKSLSPSSKILKPATHK